MHLHTQARLLGWRLPLLRRFHENSVGLPIRSTGASVAANNNSSSIARES